RAWPAVRILVRGDAGYGVPWMYAACDKLRVEYLFGIAANAVLKRQSDAVLEQAVHARDQTQTPQRMFDGFWYQAQSWEEPRWLIVKAEANAQGTNRHLVVTNRPGASIFPGAAYDEYA